MNKSMRRCLAALVALIMVWQMIPCFSIAQAAEITEESLSIRAFPTMDINSVLWKNEYRMKVISGDNAPEGALDVYWDKDNLYIGLVHRGANKANFSINGISMEYYLEEDGNALYTIPLSDLGINELDYNGSISFSGTLFAENGSTATLGENVADLYFALDVSSTTTYYGFPNRFNESNSFATVGNGVYCFDTSDTSIDAVQSNYLIGMGVQNNVLHSTHTQYIDQTLYIEDMPVAEYAYNGSDTLNGYTFILGDRTGSSDGYWSNKALCCTIMNSNDGELTLYVADNSSEGYTEVGLGRNLGETFTLGTQWNLDESLDIYIDGIYVNTIENVTRAVTGANNNLSIYYYRPSSLDDKVKLTVSNIAIYSGIPVSIADEINVVSYFDDVRDVRNDISLPAEIESDYLGKVNIGWFSSNEAVVTAEGKVTRPADEDVEVSLNATIVGLDVWKADLGSVNVSVKKAVPAQEAVIIAHHTFEENSIEWDYSNGIIGVENGAPSGGIAAYWNKDYLYLGLEFYDADMLTIEINEKTIQVDLLAGRADAEGVTVSVDDNNAQIALSLAAIDLQLLDYNVDVDFLVTLTDSSTSVSSVSALSEKGKLLFTVDTIPKLSVALDGQNISGDNRYPGVVSNVTLSNNVAVFENDGTFISEIESKYMDTLIEHEVNMLFEQTLTVSELPITQAKYYAQGYGDGYAFYLIDGMANPNGSGSYGCMVLSTLHNVGDGKLQLVVSGGSTDKWTAIDLGVCVGDTFTLGTLWTADDTFSVYVDDELKGTVEGYTFEIAYYGKDLYALKYQASTAGSAKIEVSDILLSYTGYTSITEEATISAVFNEQIPVMLEDDIDLPDTFESVYLGALPLTWESSNNEILSSDGTVTRPEGTQEVEVELSASITGGVNLWTLKSTVKAAETPSPKIVSAAFTEADVTMNGMIDTATEGWLLNTSVLTDGGKCTAKFGVQWQLDKLYLAVAANDSSEMKLTLDGHIIDFANERVTVVQSDLTEIAIPMDLLGIHVSDYGIEIPVDLFVGEGHYSGTVVLTSIDWYGESEPETNRSAILDSGLNGGTANQGVQTITNGYYLFDHYDEGGNNPAAANSSVYIRFPKADTSKPTDHPLWIDDETYYYSFDFQAVSMPVYSATVAGPDIRRASDAFSWYTTNHRDGKTADFPSDVALFGIYNSSSGLQLVVSGENDLQIVPLNKQVGELFRVGVAIDPDSNAIVFIDGEEFARFTNVEKRLTGMVTYNEHGAFSMSVTRNGDVAKSKVDNFDIYVTNFAFGLYYGEELLDSLTFDTISGENDNQYEVTTDLELVNVISNDQLTTPVVLTWESSNPGIISSDGTVTRPQKGGALVTLHASTADGRVKEIEVFVKGVDASGEILTVYRDMAPASSSGVAADSYRFTLDEDNKSIIYNLGSVQNVNVVKLTDGDNISRLHPDVLELYVSNDNITYDRVENFKLFHSGRHWYLYDFDAEGQYVKVHCTHYDGAEADFSGVLSEMIIAYYEDTFGQGDGYFAEITNVTVTNTSGIGKTDAAWAIAVNELGDVFQTADYSDVRFFLDDELLYHYYENGKFVVRIPELAAGASVTITVKTGNSKAMDISNKEYVHEMIYGTREVSNRYEYSGNRIARTMTMSNGVVIAIDCLASGIGMAQQYSYDGGESWSEPEPIECSVDWIGNAIGFVYDSLNDRIYFAGYDYRTDPYTTRFIYSDDCGQTWHRGFDMGPGAAAYVDGIELSTNDGAGPNVDFVLGMGDSRYDENGVRIGLKAFAVYSTDGGETWIQSEDKLFVECEEGTENGVSENSIVELPNGDLVMYARWQAPDSDHFAVYYSYNHGINWTTDPVISDVYTVNTNPILHNYDGTYLLMWSGNAALGGTSYRRIPLSIANFTETEDLLSLANVQDLYAKYSLQGLDTASQNQCTNPHIIHNDDDLLICWFNNFIETLHMRVENFDDYLFKTKGAYDSFEGRTPKYEGWSTIYGNACNSNDQASEGNYSMLFNADTAAARSTPSVSNGTITMDVYVPAYANFRIELQTAYNINGSASPLILEAADGVLCGVQLQEGWNNIAINLALSNGKASVSINGVLRDVAVNMDIGNYICFVYLAAYSDTTMYLDDFMVVDDDILSASSSSGQGDALDDFDIVNYTKDAKVTDPERGWIQGTNTFTVYSENACAVAVSNDGGQTYIRLQATTTEAENTYSFTVDNVSADTKIIVMLKGDANADGKISVADRLILNRALMDENEPAYVALDTIGAVACDLNGDGMITVVDRLALHRALLDTDNSAYAAPEWDE